MPEVLKTLQYLRAIFEGADGFVEFRLIGKGKTTQHFAPVQEVFDNWPEFEKRLLAANQAGASIYYGAHLRTDKVGDAAHVKGCRIVYADLDYKDADLLDKNYAAIKGFNLTPTFIIDTGHGYHLIWVLKEEVPHAVAEKIMKTLARVLAGDHVWDAPRVLRLPGTMNVKSEPFVPCEIVKADPDRQYAADDFDPLEGVAPGVPPSGTKSPATPPATSQATPKPRTCNTMPPPSLVAYGNGHGFAQEMANAIAPFWQSGIRHKLVLGIAGLFRKDEIPQEGAEYILQKVADATRDDEFGDRLAAIRSTYQKEIDEISASTAVREALGDKAQNFLRSYGRAIDHIPPPPVKRPTLPDFDLYKCVPFESMFDQYVQYAYSHTDAPLQYHAAAIITAVAAALGNRVCIPNYHGKRLNPNLFTMIVGPSSRYRKSTSIDLISGISYGAKVPSYPGSSTTEAMYVKMCPNECEWREEPIKSGPNKGQTKKIPIAWEGTPYGIIYHKEFSNYLSASAKSYMQGSREFLTDLYDGGMPRDMASRETKTQGKYYVTNPAISMLCAVTPVGIKEFVTKFDAKGGFLSRFLVVMHPENHQNRFEWNRPKTEDIDKVFKLTNWLASLCMVKGDMEMSPEAETLWVEFNKWIHDQIEEMEGTRLIGLDSFYTRLIAIATKIAMVYAWGCRLPASTIEASDMRYAIELCKYSAAALKFFFEETRPDEGNREIRYMAQILESSRGYVRKNGGVPIPHRLLLQNSHLDSEQFRRAIESLIAEGRITITTTANRRGPGGKAYVLNEIEE